MPYTDYGVLYSLCRYSFCYCCFAYFQVTSSHSDGMDPSLQLDVPLFDVDKVRENDN